MKKVIYILNVLMFFILLSCYGEKKEIKLGYLAALTGGSASLGIEGRNGFMLAIDDFNQRTNDKYKIIPVIKDHAANMDKASLLIDEFHNEGVLGIVGPMVSSTAKAILPKINENGIVVLSPTVSSNELSDIDDNFFRIYPKSREQATLTAKFIRDELQVKRVSIILDKSNAAHTESWAAAFNKVYLDSSHKVMETIPFMSKSAIFQLIVKSVSKESEAVLILANDFDSALICQQILKNRRSLIKVVSEWSTTNEIFDFGGESVNGLTFFSTVAHSDANDAYLNYKKNYQRHFGDFPSFSAIHAYDSTMILLESLSQKSQSESLKAFLIKQKKFKILQGMVEFDRFGDVKRDLHLTTIDDGAFTQN